ncbi:hypothetical protein [Streptomyces sp. NPDC047981]|uniref:hypothetical protein n=1 Tax=Streptomyces sp. NPDC047981 TaxID=3154610 RepID=UPI0034325E19
MAEQQDGERDPQPIDEEAAWAAIVAGYGEEPADPPGAKPFRSVEDLALPEPVDGEDDTDAEDSDKESDDESDDEDEDDDRDGPAKPALGSSIVFAPGVGVGVGGGGPRDYELADPDAEPDGTDAADGKKTGRAKKDEDDGEGHFVPPEPPPLPEADATTKFAWLGVVGGPVLLLLAVLLQWDMTWWLTTVCVGGFLGGFATLIARMKHDDDDDGYDDPGRGAVV